MSGFDHRGAQLADKHRMRGDNISDMSGERWDDDDGRKVVQMRSYHFRVFYSSFGSYCGRLQEAARVALSEGRDTYMSAMEVDGTPWTGR